MLASYCDYCGWGYYKRICRICKATIEVYGCDCARDVCEEHYCAGCDVAWAVEELDGDGLCPNCVEVRAHG